MLLAVSCLGNVMEEKVFITTFTKIIFITVNTKCYILFHNLLSLLTEIHSSSAGNFVSQFVTVKRSWCIDLFPSVYKA
jgi:hypothetical protein